jgi:hypothetical protein
VAEPAIRFDVAATPPSADPARMDVALFVGFCPGLPAGPAVAVESSDELAALTRSAGQRADGIPGVVGTALPEPFRLPPGADPELVVTVDGVEQAVPVPLGPLSLAELAAALDGTTGTRFTAAVMRQGAGQHLHIVRRERDNPGRLTVRANLALGFPVAVTATSAAIGATLPRAVSAFFRAGGRRAWVASLGEPGPYLASRAERVGRLLRLLAPDGEPLEVPDSLNDAAAAGLPLPPLAGRRDPPERWRGVAAALGVEEAFFLCLPDLAELVSPLPEPASAGASDAAGRPEIFATCTAPAPATFAGSAALLPPPGLDGVGIVLWRRVLRHLLVWLRSEAPDRMLLLSLPPLLPEPSTASPRADLEALLAGLPEEALDLCQLAQPWPATADAADLPGGLVPAEAALAGLLAAHSLANGCFRSAGGQPLAGVGRFGEELADPEARTARFASTPAGIVLAADRTPSRDLTGRHAAVRRLTAMLLRAAGRLGMDAVFEPAGERLWRDIEIRLQLLLEGIFTAGGLRGRDARAAFFARCDRSTMTESDVAQGRVIAEVGFAPALPVERIRVRLALGAGTPTLVVGGTA